MRILSTPSRILYGGLNRALEDDRPDVATQIINTIRVTQRRGPIPDGLVRALQFEGSRVVRFAAAVAIAHWNPSSDFDYGEQVVDVLSESVISGGVRTVHKVMGSRVLANQLDAKFRDLNIESYSARKTIEEGYASAIDTPPDAIFVDTQVRISSNSKGVAPINHLVTQLRKNYRTNNVPVVVLVPESDLASAKRRYASEERKVEVIGQGTDSVGLGLLMNRLFSGHADDQAAATAMAAQAAEALAYVAERSHSLIPAAQSSCT